MANDEKEKGKNKKLLAAIAVAAILVAGGGFVTLSGAGGLLNGIGNAGNTNPQITELSPAQDVVKIPLSNITSTLSFYTYKSNGTAMKFFAVKGTDGNVHVALDTCDVCGPKGYTQSGNDVVCNNCGKHFAINSIGTANLSGGCWPSHLPMSINGSSVVIKTSDLVSKESAFKTWNTAPKEVGATGQVVSVDMTPEMVEQAPDNASNAEHENVEFRLGEIERLPLADALIDVAISMARLV